MDQHLNYKIYLKQNKSKNKKRNFKLVSYVKLIQN